MMTTNYTINSTWTRGVILIYNPRQKARKDMTDKILTAQISNY